MAIPGWHPSGLGDAVGSQVLVIVFGLKELSTPGEVMASRLYLNCREDQIPTQRGPQRCNFGWQKAVIDPRWKLT